MNDIRDRFSRTSNPSVPNLSPGTSQLLGAVMNDEIPLDELVQLLEQCPVVVARLIGVANSAWSAPQGEIVAIKPACARLGMDVVRTVVMAITVSAPFDFTQCAGFDVERFWCSGLLLGDTAQMISPQFEIDPQLARSAGLIRHLGLLWLIHESPSLVEKAISSVREEAEGSLNQALIAQCGIGYLEAATYLFRAWSLDNALVKAVDPQTDPNDALVRLLRLASTIADALYEGLEAGSIEIPDTPGIDQNVVQDIFDKQTGKLERIRELASTLCIERNIGEI